MGVEWKKVAFYDEVATTFLGLPDTPAGYVLAGAYYRVNAATNAVEEGLVAGAASGLATLDAGGVCAQDPKLHAASHQNGGGDEISVAGLSGELADDQPPKAHAVSHEDGGGDEIDVGGLSGELADPQPPKAHAADHKNGGADEILLNEFGEPTAKVPFDGQQAGDFVLENLAANPAVPVLGKIYFKTGDLHPYVCTSIE